MCYPSQSCDRILVEHCTNPLLIYSILSAVLSAHWRSTGNLGGCLQVLKPTRRFLRVILFGVIINLVTGHGLRVWIWLRVLFSTPRLHAVADTIAFECCSLIFWILKQDFSLAQNDRTCQFTKHFFVRRLLLPCTSQLSRPAISRDARTINHWGVLRMALDKWISCSREASKFGCPSRHHSRVWFHHLHDRHMHVLTFVQLSELTFILEGVASQS